MRIGEGIVRVSGLAYGLFAANNEAKHHPFFTSIGNVFLKKDVDSPFIRRSLYGSIGYGLGVFPVATVSAIGVMHLTCNKSIRLTEDLTLDWSDALED